MIYIFTQRDPFFIDEFIYFFDKFGEPYTLCEFPNFNQGILGGVKRALALYGPLGFIKLALYGIYLKFSRPQLKNCHQRLRFQSGPDSVSLLSSMKPSDVLLSLSAPCRIPVECISVDVPKVNIHCGRLPQFAGMMPIFWQILAGRDSITIVLHELAQEIDRGVVYVEKEMPVRASLFETSVIAKRISAEIFYGYMGALRSGSNCIDGESGVTPEREVRLSKFPTRADIRRFSRLMRRI